AVTMLGQRFPYTPSLLKSIDVVLPTDARVHLGEAAGAIFPNLPTRSPFANRYFINQDILAQRDLPQLLNTLTHELHHRAQQRLGLTRSGRSLPPWEIEPPAYLRG